jgi:hypothetical protein
MRRQRRHRDQHLRRQSRRRGPDHVQRPGRAGGRVHLRHPPDQELPGEQPPGVGTRRLDWRVTQLARYVTVQPQPCRTTRFGDQAMLGCRRRRRWPTLGCRRRRRWPTAGPNAPMSQSCKQSKHPQAIDLGRCAHREGFEPPTARSVAWCSASTQCACALSVLLRSAGRIQPVTYVPSRTGWWTDTRTDTEGGTSLKLR